MEGWIGVLVIWGCAGARLTPVWKEEVIPPGTAEEEKWGKALT